MIFTTEEIESITILSLNHPLVGKLWSQLQKYEGDQAMQFYSSLADKIVNLDKNIKDCSAKEFNRYVMILTNSKKILEGLELGQKMKDKLNGGVEEKIKNKEKQKEEMSISDLMAESTKK